MPRLLPDLAIVLALLALAIALRHPAEQLSRPFWLDEAWVADSVRAPLHTLRFVSPPTPIGWTLLLRLVPPVDGPERYRLLPLAFGAGSVLPAYLLGWRLAPGARRYAAAAALAVAATPVLLYQDLKQYPADVFVAILLLLLGARLEAGWSVRRLAGFVALALGALYFSHPAAFVATSILAAVGLVALGRRAWRRCVEVLVALVVFLAGLAAVYRTVDRPVGNPRLTSYWSSAYVPLEQGRSHALAFVGERAKELLSSTGVSPHWWVPAIFALLGTVALWRLGHPAIALVLPILTGEAVAAAALRSYPLWVSRTSLFWLGLLAVVGAVGAVHAVSLVPAPAGRAALSALLIVLTVPIVWRGSPPPPVVEDVRWQVGYVEAHQRPGDVVILDAITAYPFAYYWRERPTFVADTTTALDFAVRYPSSSAVIITPFGGHTAEAAGNIARAGQEAESHHGRVWIVLSHMSDASRTWWLVQARRHGLTQVIAHRPEPLILLEPGPRHGP